jgi:hypothetical protein
VLEAIEGFFNLVKNIPVARRKLITEHVENRKVDLVRAGGYFEIFETLSFVYWVVSLPPPVQARLRQWFDEHLQHFEKQG